MMAIYCLEEEVDFDNIIMQTPNGDCETGFQVVDRLRYIDFEIYGDNYGRDKEQITTR